MLLYESLKGVLTRCDKFPPILSCVVEHPIVGCPLGSSPVAVHVLSGQNDLVQVSRSQFSLRVGAGRAKKDLL